MCMQTRIKHKCIFPLFHDIYKLFLSKIPKDYIYSLAELVSEESAFASRVVTSKIESIHKDHLGENEIHSVF